MDWRKRKKELRKLSERIQRLGYFEDCNYHPCRVTRLLPYITSNPSTRFSADVDGVSLVDDGPTSCSLYHCGPLPLTKEQAEERAEFCRTHTWLEYLETYVYDGPLSEEQRQETVKFIQEWNFRTNGRLT